MAKTLIICESTQKGVDKAIITALIETDSLLPAGTYTIETAQNGSIKDVKEYLKNWLAQEVYKNDYKTVLVIVDADDKPKERFKEIVQCISRQFLSVVGVPKIGFKLPQNTGDSVPDHADAINVGIYLLPNNKNAGGLETLCWEALRGIPKVLKNKKYCIEAYMECLKSKRIDQNKSKNNTDKSRFRVYRATPNPDGYVHDLLKEIDIHSPVFDDLKSFLRQAA